MKGYSSQVTLFPVVFEKGYGCTLTDVDGNVYLDFSSGIYVTTLGHCHPKVTAAVQQAAGQLMNCHDFTTPLSSGCSRNSSKFCLAIWQGCKCTITGRPLWRLDCGFAVPQRESMNSSLASVISMAKAGTRSVWLA